jgi:chromosome segregation ATPase
MKTHASTIKNAAAALTEATAKLERIADQRAKFQAAHGAASQSADILRAKVGRFLALQSVGEAKQTDVDAAAAELAAAESKRDTFALTLTGFGEEEAAAQAAIAAARTARSAAIRAGLDAHFDRLAGEYHAAATTLADLHRRVHAISRIRRSLGQPEDASWHAFRSDAEAREFGIVALNHEAFDADRRGPNNEFFYWATGELHDSTAGRQGAATDAEIALLRSQGLEV